MHDGGTGVVTLVRRAGLALVGVAAVVWSAVPVLDWGALAVAAGQGSNPLAFAVTVEGVAATLRYLPLVIVCFTVGTAATMRLLAEFPDSDEPDGLSVSPPIRTDGHLMCVHG